MGTGFLVQRSGLVSGSVTADKLGNDVKIFAPNLLDNWYFGNPVNQRGQTSYTSIADKNMLTIDRWKAYGGPGTITVENGCISLINPTTGAYLYLLQNLENPLVCQTYVISALVVATSGNCFLRPLYTDDSTEDNVYLQEGLNKAAFTSTKNLTRLTIGVPPGASITLKAVKAELGSVQTLAHQDADGSWALNEIPDYGEQLERCQRYYQKSVGASTLTLCYGNGYLYGFRLPKKMRATPTILSCIVENPKVSNSAQNIDISKSSVNSEGFAYMNIAEGMTDVYYVVKSYELSADV